MLAAGFRSMWPQASVYSEEGYVATLAAFFLTLPAEKARGLLHPNGIVTKHKFPPSIAEIHEWTKPWQPKNYLSAPDYHGPNFTRQRLMAENNAPRLVGPTKPAKSEAEKAAMIDGLIGKRWRDKSGRSA